MKDGKFHPHTDYKKGVRKSRDTTVKTKGVKVERKARESESTRCMMGGKHVRIDSPDKFDPYNACKKCGFDIRLKDGKWITTTYDEREYYNKKNSWERKARVTEDEFPLDTVMKKIEKDIEAGLKEHDFTNPKLRNKQWSVGITYEGGFSEESFGFWAQPVDESIEPVKISEWISNDEWSSTGDFDEDEKLQKKFERNPDFAEREYAKWLASSFEQYDDHWFIQLADAIENEHP